MVGLMGNSMVEGRSIGQIILNFGEYYIKKRNKCFKSVTTL